MMLAEIFNQEDVIKLKLFEVKGICVYRIVCFFFLKSFSFLVEIVCEISFIISRRCVFCLLVVSEMTFLLRPSLSLPWRW